MIVSLGYIAYFLIGSFSWLQLAYSLRKKTINLSSWSMASLAVGLVLLQFTLFYGVVPTYVIIGNGVSTLGTIGNLLRIMMFKHNYKTRRKTLLDEHQTTEHVWTQVFEDGQEYA